MSKVKPNVEEEKLQQLQTLLEAAKTARPSPADEERMAGIVSELLAGNKAAVTLGVEALLKLPWSLAVKAACEAWPKVKPTGRKQFLAALTAQAGEEARRVRLSLSRGLVALDAESAHKILQEVCAAMLPEPESALAGKDRQGIFNVLIGKGKPWLQHLDLAAWGAEEQLALAQCVLQAAPVAAPFTQEALLRWASALGVLEKISKATADSVIAMLNRWPGKLRKDLEKLPHPLPETISANLRQPAEPQQPRQPQPLPKPENGETGRQAADQPAAPKPEQKVVPRTTVVSVTRQPAEPRPQQPQSPQQPRMQEFDLATSLRQIEQYVTRLRKDLREAQSVKEPRESRGRRRGDGRGDEPAKTANHAEVESLLRHNAQLEATVAELRERFEELTQDHEDRAAIMSLDDPLGQFKSLLTLKLKDSFAEYHALRGQTPNDVLRRHYGDLLGQVFEVLQAEGVALDAP